MTSLAHFRRKSDDAADRLVNALSYEDTAGKRDALARYLRDRNDAVLGLVAGYGGDADCGLPDDEAIDAALAYAFQELVDEEARRSEAAAIADEKYHARWHRAF